MTTALYSFFSKSFNPVWLAGPIFDKELRVSSRRKRNYYLRCCYIILLGIFVLSTWYTTVIFRSSGSAVYQISRLSQAGRHIITAIIWFQFIVAQIIAIVMLSSSISDEIHTGTMNVLMTTPISSFQIVTGKLMSKLLQLILLLAISLPLLAIIRVFGGVPWDYVVSSVFITLSASVFAGSMSLLLSMSYRNSYSVIMSAVIGYLLVFAALPGLFSGLAAARFFNQQTTQSVLALTSPFWALLRTTEAMSSASGKNVFSWPMHCLIMLAVTAILITISVWRVRKVALKAASGRNVSSKNASARIIKRVTGSPIVWKEMRKGLIGRGKGNIVLAVLLIGLFFLAIISIFLPSGLRSNIFLSLLATGFYLVVMIRLAVFSAGGIAAEKDARTWPVLLATPLENKEIVRGKAIAAFRRNLPLLLLYFALFCIQYINMVIVIGRSNFSTSILVSFFSSAIGLVASVIFVIGSGLYFGVRLRTATAAVAATAGLYLVIYGPFVGIYRLLTLVLYSVLFGSILGARGSSAWIHFATAIFFMLFQAGIGLFFMRCAVRRLRRDIF
jgi:ABC-type transport system involved in multi-copper enzyme maturation permease subunit